MALEGFKKAREGVLFLNIYIYYDNNNIPSIFLYVGFEKRSVYANIAPILNKQYIFICSV